MHMIAPIKAGNADCCMCYEQETDDASQRGGKRGDDNERVEPRLKVDDDQQIDENDGKNESSQQTEVGRTHSLQLALDGHEAAAAGTFGWHRQCA